MGKNQFVNNSQLVKSKKELEKIIASEVSFEIEAGFEKIIDAFYNDYMPVIYERTESTYLASSNYNDLSHIENGNRGGIIVDSANIPGQPYYNHWGVNKGKPMNTEWVFERTYDGIHGLTRNNYFSLKNGDYSENIQKKARTKYDAEFYRKTKNKSDEYKNQYKKSHRYKRPKYFLEKYFKFRYYQDSSGSMFWGSEKAYFRMSPSPRKMMTKAFNDFKKGNGKMRPNSKDSHTITEISNIAITEYLKKHPIF